MSTTTTSISNRFTFDKNDKTSFIGQGGMGSVYRGMDITSQQPVAIKVLKSDLMQRDPDILKRFTLEGEALRQLNHPNIVKMLDAADVDGLHYLVMEYVSGGSLRDVLDESPRLSIQRALYIALDLADALTRAHRLRILHRDIKPDNVLMANDGTPRLTDFGMARMTGEPNITQDGAIVGTMAYIAPEVFQGETPDERSDIWAFGIMLYEMLAGQRPFPETQPAPLINSIITHPVPDLEATRSDAPTALIDLIYRMLLKDRNARIPSVRLIGAELEAIIRSGDSSTTMQPIVHVQDSTGRFEFSDTQIPTNVSTGSIKAPNNLPNQPTPFVGRDKELKDLHNIVENDADIVTLVGSGGVGKTRIALEFAEHQLGNYVDGVYLIPLAPLEKGEHLIPTIAENLDFTFGSADVKGDLLNYLHEKRMLLIFDNFEHLSDHAQILSDIQKAAPNVLIVATSRERLRLRGEQIYEISGMILPDKRDETPDNLVNYPAAQLFLQSAHRVAPDFEIDDDETAHDLAEVIRLVGGLPLGIELAAAWLDSLPIDEIASEIAQGIDFLETDLRDVPERQRSIRAVFDYSWNLMTDEEKIVFMKLSVFRGGFEREAAQKVAGASLRNLTNLVNKSLLNRDPNGRYRVQKLLRQYAEELLSDDLDTKMDAHVQHAMYYSNFLTKLAPAYNTPKELDAVEAVDKELENVRYMWRNVVQHGKYDILADGIETMHYYYIAHSMLHEAYQAFDDLAQALLADGREDALYWKARIRQAWISTRLGRYDEVMGYATKGLEYFKQCDDCVERAHALNQISYVHMMRGDYESSKQAAKEASDNVDPTQDRTAWIMGKGNLAYAHYLAGELRQAYEIQNDLVNMAQEVGYSLSGIGYGKNNLGEMLRDMGRTNEALALFKDAYRMFSDYNHKRGMAFTMNNIGGVIFVSGQYEEAKQCYEQSLQLNKEIGDPWGTAHSLSALGNVADALGDYDLAETKYQESLKIRRNIGNKSGISDSLNDLARNLFNRGKLREAVEKLDEAIDLNREMGNKLDEAGSILFRALAGIILQEEHDYLPEVEYAIEVAEEAGSPMYQVMAYIGKGLLLTQNDQLDEAAGYFKRALSAYELDGNMPIPMLLFALLGFAEIEMCRQNYQKALEIVSLVMRYPSNMIGFIDQHAAKMLKTLQEKLDKQTVETTMTETKSLVLHNVIMDILAS